VLNCRAPYPGMGGIARNHAFQKGLARDSLIL
jgi:hypothetical protein